MVISKINGISVITGAMTGEQIRDTLSGLADEDRRFILTDPESGEQKVISLSKDDATGKVIVTCNDQPEP